MAVDYYGDKLRMLLDNPGGFQATPGYQFARDQGLKAFQRSKSAMRGSGNVLAELTRLGAGYASQEYGNQVDRMGRLLGQEQQYELGKGANENTRRAGDQSYGLGLYRAGNDFTLGSEQNANTAGRNMLDFYLGNQQNENTAERNWWDAQTNWRNATSQDRWRRAQTNQDWWKLVGS